MSMAPYGAQMQSLFPVMTPALRAMSPWILLLFCLPTLIHGAPMKRDFDPNEKFYWIGNIRCLRCPPGRHVLKHCTAEDTESTCAPCIPGYTYSEFLTGQTDCLRCTVCRTDQEEESPCTIYKNSKCKCKQGTYCPLGEDCEICLKCKTSCPESQVIQMPCNSTSDIQCGPPETNNNIVAILLPILVFIIILALICFLFFYYRKKCDGSRWIPKILTVSPKCEKPRETDAKTPFLSQGPKLRFKDNITENEKNEAITKTFSIFADQVPPSKFGRFVRDLGLANNDIERANDDHRDTYNKNFAMLMMLHQDKKFDVNIWLQKLCDLKMKKVAEDIIEKLTMDELYEQTSHI